MLVSNSGRCEPSWRAFVPVCVLRRHSPWVYSPRPNPLPRLSTELGGVINNRGPRFKGSPHLVDGNGITEEWSHKTWAFEGWWCESIDSSVSIWSVRCAQRQEKDTRNTDKFSLLFSSGNPKINHPSEVIKRNAEINRHPPYLHQFFFKNIVHFPAGKRTQMQDIELFICKQRELQQSHGWFKVEFWEKYVFRKLWSTTVFLMGAHELL